jgi:hypothetical protein
LVLPTTEDAKLIDRHSTLSLGLSTTSQQYFFLRTNQPPATSQQYSSLRTNQHQPSATSQPNRLPAGEDTFITRHTVGDDAELN